MTTTELVIGSYNLHMEAVVKHPDEVVADILRLLKTCHVIGVQEAGMGVPLLRDAALKHGFGIYQGEGLRGQAATPIIYRSTIKVLEQKTIFLTPATKVGPDGAGGPIMKAKFLNLINFKFNNRNIWVGNIHTVPSVYLPVRHDLAVIQFTEVGNALKELRGVKFLTGDLNTKPDSSLRDPLEAAGLRSSQLELGEIPTHESRAIDDIYFTEDSLITKLLRRVKLIRHRTSQGVSDHLAYIAAFEIRPRVIRRRKRR